MRFLRINSTVSVIALFLVGLLGCNVQETTPSMLATDGINQELVKEIEGITEYQVQKIAFTQMLTNQEKTYFFKKRIIEKMQAMPLTVEQKDHLSLLLANVTPELYDGASARGRKTMDFLNQWTTKGKAIFEKGTLYYIVGSLSPDNGGTMTNLMAPPSTTKCGCATTSNYCGDHYDCNYIPSCRVPGCGTFLAYTCNGSCDLTY